MLNNKLTKYFIFKSQNYTLLSLINFFVLLEIYLFISGAIRLNALLNVYLYVFVLFVFLFEPLAKKLSSFKIARFFVSVVLAVLVLWEQSWLPDIKETYLLLKQYGLPSFDYISSFTNRIFTMPLIFSLLTLILVSYSLRKIEAISLFIFPFLLLAMSFIAEVQGNSNDILLTNKNEQSEQVTPTEFLEDFHAEESERAVLFSHPEATDPPFDVVVLHVCSLSWHDMNEIDKSKDEPFFQQFDYLFNNFNTAASYSGPAMHRLLLANCGQSSHSDLYDDNIPSACQLFESLASVGYQTSVTMNNNGGYEDFIDSVKSHMPKETQILSPEKLEPQAIFFDGESKLYNDFDALKQWQSSVERSNPKRAALYYNSVLLHAGVRWRGEKTSRGRDPHKQFIDVYSALTEDLQAFINSLQKSERNTLLFFVPEHGRALVGNAIQLPDVRDIPVPSITKVPVGVKLIGPDFTKQQQQEINKPTSYFALSWLISKFIKQNPFAEKAPDAIKLAKRMPKTAHISENGDRVVIEFGEKTLYRDNDGEWILLKKEQQ